MPPKNVLSQRFDLRVWFVYGLITDTFNLAFTFVWVILYLVKLGQFYCVQDGNPLPMNVKVGDSVLVPEYGGTKLTFGEEKVRYGFSWSRAIPGFQ